MNHMKTKHYKDFGFIFETIMTAMPCNRRGLHVFVLRVLTRLPLATITV